MRKWVFPLLLAVATIIVYANSLPNPFFWDDLILITENPYVKNFRNLPYWFTTDLGRGGSSNFYRPVQILVYSLLPCRRTAAVGLPRG